MSIDSLIPSIPFIENGDPLTPETANRPIKALASYVSQLAQRLNAYTDYSSNMLYGQPLDEDVHVGAPVYFNKETGTFSRARVSTYVEHDQLVAEDSCYVLGVVTRKTAPQVGHICLGGVVEIDFEENGGNQEDNGDYTSDYLSLGLRYLSSTVPGRVVIKAPVVAIPVAFVLREYNDGKALILVSVCLDKLLSNHRHHRILMKARPSGQWSKVSREFLTQNDQIEGWLPITNLPDGAPVGAKFQYNVTPESDIREYFPLLIPNAFKLHWSQYTNDADPTPVLGEVYASGSLSEEPLYVVTTDGIWWMSDEYLPWYTETDWDVQTFINGDPPISVPVLDSNTQWPTIPLDMLAYYTTITFGTDDAVVTSLQTPETSGLEITNFRTGAPALRGDLLIDLALQNKSASERFLGPRVLKYIGHGRRDAVDIYGTKGEEAVRNGFFFGPVVESVEVDSIFTLVETVDRVYTDDGRPSGRIRIHTDSAWSRLPLPVQSVHLDQMRDAFLGGMVALSFFPNQKSGFSGNIYIPIFAPQEFDKEWSEQLKATVRIRLTLACGAAGQISGDYFTGSHAVIPALPCGQPQDLPMTIPSLCNPQGEHVSDTPDAPLFDFEVYALQNQYFTVCSKPIEVTPGSMLWFSWHKEAAGYDGSLSIIKMEAYFDE